MKGCRAPLKNPDGALQYQQAFRQMRALSIQLQISPLSSAILKPNQAKLIMYNLGQGRIQGGDDPLKPTKVTLFIMFHTFQKTTFAIKDHFFVHCFVTAVL